MRTRKQNGRDCEDWKSKNDFWFWAKRTWTNVICDNVCRTTQRACNCQSTAAAANIQHRFVAEDWLVVEDVPAKASLWGARILGAMMHWCRVGTIVTQAPRWAGTCTWWLMWARSGSAKGLTKNLPSEMWWGGGWTCNKSTVTWSVLVLQANRRPRTDRQREYRRLGCATRKSAVWSGEGWFQVSNDFESLLFPGWTWPLSVENGCKLSCARMPILVLHGNLMHKFRSNIPHTMFKSFQGMQLGGQQKICQPKSEVLEEVGNPSGNPSCDVSSKLKTWRRNELHFGTHSTHLTAKIKGQDWNPNWRYKQLLFYVSLHVNLNFMSPLCVTWAVCVVFAPERSASAAKNKLFTSHFCS